MTVPTTLVPLAITLDTEGGACVAGVTAAGRWLRPEPVTAADVTGAVPRYRFFQPVTVTLAASAEPGARPEDRAIAGPVTDAGPALDTAERAGLLDRIADDSVERAFAGERSAGLVRARVRGFERRRSTGGRSFVRVAFTDPAGADHDWIVRDVRVLRAFGETGDLTGAQTVLAAAPVFLSIGLTKPNGRFPGRFRGCHPLVVGVLTADADLPAWQKGVMDAPGVA
ncbi:hypothetical protein SD37_16850 [Amycolatopsis orientalis]|uniref:Uncharacterized protein n=1 Tax=Amycolatopsis orientalis TaxID=31958 RepID=A0A193BY36_AMYOR|nr:hypothetical protein [Amycolatopsis orientalis]ANN17146.1 hypothetical protein SD37_16850 [Amycolatopsis orientalis]